MDQEPEDLQQSHIETRSSIESPRLIVKVIDLKSENQCCLLSGEG